MYRRIIQTITKTNQTQNTVPVTTIALAEKMFSSTLLGEYLHRKGQSGSLYSRKRYGMVDFRKDLLNLPRPYLKCARKIIYLVTLLWLRLKLS